MSDVEVVTGPNPTIEHICSLKPARRDPKDDCLACTQAAPQELEKARVIAETLSTDKPAKGLMGKDTVRHFNLMEIRPFLKTLNARLTRKRYSETTLREYISQIQPVGLAEQYLELYDAHPFHKEVCAGAKHHHWWKGGLESHLCEMIGLGMDLMDLYPGDFTFTKSDVIIVIFLHDFAKIWTYRYITPEEREKKSNKFKEKQIFTYVEGAFNRLDAESTTLLELSRRGITPTDNQWSAVLFAEGGFAKAHFSFQGRTSTGSTVNTVNHLAPFVHLLDLYSSQILGKSIA